ncbi:MAG: hypothetical protein C4547_00265 [Phycisphaerales bacterium]|nr:MAG: hypothetical protein C4547_00265 [Phycisphaerales bacterium]
MKTIHNTALLLLAATVVAAPVSGQEPLGGGFTYQGQIRRQGEPLNDSADFLFTLWDASVDGNMIGAELAAEGVPVSEGLFTAELDFGAAAFNGEARWLEIAVRSPAGEGEYTRLSPRQPLTATPYSLQTRGIFVNAAGNRVGIGTRSPGSSLEVNGGVRARGGPPGGFGVNNNGYAFSGNGGDNDSGMFSSADGLLQFFTNNQEHVRISPNGNVGIGTDNPAQKLDIGGVPGTDGIRFPDGTLQTSAARVRTVQQLHLVRGYWEGFLNGAGFSVSRLGPGDYRITFSNQWASAPTVLVTPVGGLALSATATPEGPSNSNIWRVQLRLAANGTPVDGSFSILAMGVRQ